jgi:large subunit ribosomal protein L10
VSLNLDQKKAVVAEVSESIANAKTAVLAEYRGLTVAQMTELRRKARESGVYLRVVKNTLARRAVEGSEFECLKEHLIGPLAFAASEDPVAVAKVLDAFASENNKLILKAGAMGGKLMSEAELKALAKLPGREELLAKLLGTMQAPVQKFVQTLNEVPSKFVRTLAAVRDSKQAA